MIVGVLRKIEGGRLGFKCPGCDMMHVVNVSDTTEPRWGFNGDYMFPTFTPSILATWSQWEPPATDLETAEKIRKGEIKQTERKMVCHSFVTNGEIQFLSDCTHDKAGQTLKLPADED